MAELKKVNKARLSGFTLIENLVAVTLILLVFVGSSMAFLKFSMLPKWQVQLTAQSVIELDYNKLTDTKSYVELKPIEQIQGYSLSREIDSVSSRLLLVSYKLSNDERLILEKDFYYLLDE